MAHNDFPNFIKSSGYMLTKEEELELFQQYNNFKNNGDEKAAENVCKKIISQYSPILVKFVHKMRGYEMDENDLMSEGLVAMMHAVERFDPNLGYRFATYAFSWIRGYILGYISKNYCPANVCTKSSSKKMFFALRRTIAGEIRHHGEFTLTEDKKEEFAEKFGATPSEVEMMNVMLNNNRLSFDAPVSSDGDHSGSYLDSFYTEENPVEDTVFDDMSKSYHTRIIQTAMDEVLTPREKRIYQKQILSEDDDAKTLHALGEEFDVSRERIRQIRVIAHKKMVSKITSMLKSDKVLPSDLF